MNRFNNEVKLHLYVLVLVISISAFLVVDFHKTVIIVIIFILIKLGP